MMNRIRQLRKKEGLTLQQVADAIGVTNNTLSRYETGKREPSVQFLIKLANLFDVTVDYLIGREPKNKVIKTYQFYVFDDDYTLRSLCDSSPISEYSVPILDKSEFEALEYSLELNNRLSQFLVSLYYCFYQEKISNSSYEKLAKIMVNKEAFQVEVIKRVDS